MSLLLLIICCSSVQAWNTSFSVFLCLSRASFPHNANFFAPPLLLTCPMNLIWLSLMVLMSGLVTSAALNIPMFVIFSVQQYSQHFPQIHLHCHQFLIISLHIAHQIHIHTEKHLMPCYKHVRNTMTMFRIFHWLPQRRKLS